MHVCSANIGCWLYEQGLLKLKHTYRKLDIKKKKRNIKANIEGRNIELAKYQRQTIKVAYFGERKLSNEQNILIASSFCVVNLRDSLLYDWQFILSLFHILFFKIFFILFVFWHLSNYGVCALCRYLFCPVRFDI